jgi:phage terminase large subunit-like protein
VDLILTPRLEAGPLEKLVYERAQRDHARAYDPVTWPYRYEPKYVERVTAFFENTIVLSEGEWRGQPIKLFPVQCFWLQEIYGWIKEDGTRRFSSAYLTLGRKSAKTSFNAGLLLYHLIGDDEFTGGAPQVYSAGTTQAQAGLSYTIARRMVRLSKELTKRIEVHGGYTIDKAMLYNPANFGVMQALTADVGTKEGLSASFLLFDELSAWKNRELIDVLESSMGARKSPLTISITTAGVYDPERIGYQRFDTARQILEGVIKDEASFAFIATSDPELPIDSDLVWAQAHPTPEGTTPTKRYREDRTAKALQSSANALGFRRFDLNQWVNSETQAITAKEWQACQSPGTGDDVVVDKPVIIGLDLSTTTDLTSVTWIAVECRTGADGLEEKHYHVQSHSWLPEEKIQEHFLEGRRFFREWVDQGWLTSVPGSVIKYSQVRDFIVKLTETLDVQHVCNDPHAATHLAQDLFDLGIEMVAVVQRFTALSAACKEFEAAVKTRRLHHYGDPVLRFSVNCLSWKVNDFEELIPTGGHNVRGKRIDPVAALITGMTMAMLESGQVPKISVFSRK